MSVFLSRYEKWGHPIDPESISVRTCLRVNTLKTKTDDFLKRLKGRVELEKVPFLPDGYWVKSEFALSSSAEYLLGLFYIQEAASQLPVIVLGPEETDFVLDMCAAPGSKTTQLSQLMHNKGRILALDTIPKRINALTNNLERCGCSNVIVQRKDARFVSDLGLKFDKVLLDAPCGGNLAIDKEWLIKREIADLKEQSRLQKSLLKAASDVLLPGGMLVYSTCSLEIEEDEEVVEWGINNLDLDLLDTGLSVGTPGLTPKTNLCRRLWPGDLPVQGFFVAKFRKK